MKILWITNIIFPDACKKLNIPTPVIGGWLYSSAKKIASDQNNKLAVATVYNGNKFIQIRDSNITYYLLPLSGNKTRYCTKLENYWKEIHIQYKPDIVHVHGTEFAHGLAYINSCGNENVVISIQGLVSVIERYYHTGLEIKDILQNITFRDIILNDNILQQRKKMRLRGEVEKQYLLKGKHFIGRTSWDKAHILTSNPTSNYYFCNEILREEFYNHIWSIDQCEKYSIFISQASYPYKGLHQVIKALPFVLQKFPYTKLYIAGDNFVTTHNWKSRILQNGYGRYIKNLINKLELNKHIIFTGPLQEKEMCMRYLKSHIFVCPSSIENSPNSLGEAQLLGVPNISTYVGGIPDMVKVDITGIIYRFEEFEMLADNIIKLFSNDKLAINISTNGKIDALKRHSSFKNNEQLLYIYNKIYNNTVDIVNQQ